MGGGKSAILSIKILTDSTKAQAAPRRRRILAGQVQGHHVEDGRPGRGRRRYSWRSGRPPPTPRPTNSRRWGPRLRVRGRPRRRSKQPAATSAEAVGLSKTAYATASAAMGASLKSLGFDQDKAAAASNKMISLGADLAATFGGTAADAVSALGATLRGEYDSSEKYGLGPVAAATVAAELRREGARTIARGRPSRPRRRRRPSTSRRRTPPGRSGSSPASVNAAAGAQEIANAKYADAKAQLGEKLLPVMAKYAPGAAFGTQCSTTSARTPPSSGSSSA